MEWTPPGPTRKSALPGRIAGGAGGGREGPASGPGVLGAEDSEAGAPESGDQRGPREPFEADRRGEDTLLRQVLGAGGAERQVRQVRQGLQEGPQAPPP